MATIRLDVNGEKKAIEAPSQMPLLWALRDRLGLTGTKYGCGVGVCGACTVHLDGRATRSCQLPLADAAKGAITTIEGLADGPVRRAWLEEDVAQCGYCQVGMIMTAAALLPGEPVPSEADLDAALSAHVCRCGTYQRIKRAVRRARLEILGRPR
jgi:isoquinoline 1-oxidoreductase subunit alpha